MPDSIFAAYETRGASREAMQFSKAEREVDPIDDSGGRNDDDWVTLTEPVPEPRFELVAVIGGLRWLQRRKARSMPTG
jgi:hypothetical protein